MIAAPVTVERPATPNRLSSSAEGLIRDRTPSPRPDVVQEERFNFSNPNLLMSSLGHQPMTHERPRRLSCDTAYSEKSEVWKPMSRDPQPAGLANHKPVSQHPYHQQNFTYSTNPHHFGGPIEHPSMARSEPVRPPVDGSYLDEARHKSPGARPKTSKTPKSPKSPKSPRSSFKKRTPKKEGPGIEAQPDIKFVRPNRSIRQHHPV
jgi:hypothetical protein